MRRGMIGAGTLAAYLMLAPLAVAAEPSANDLLFESKHLALAVKGTELVYRFQRTVSDAKVLGEPFSDDIKVAITGADAEGQKDLAVYMFTGDRAREVQNDTKRTGNPVIIIYLDRAMVNFNTFAGGNRNYWKQEFIKALRSRAQVDAVKVDYKGKTVDGKRIQLVPYAGDKNVHRMEGYENAKFTMVVSDAVPGHFVELVQTFESTKPGAPKLEERITLVGSGGVK